MDFATIHCSIATPGSELVQYGLVIGFGVVSPGLELVYRLV